RRLRGRPDAGGTERAQPRSLRGQPSRVLAVARRAGRPHLCADGADARGAGVRRDGIARPRAAPVTRGRGLREAHIWRVAFPARQAALNRLLGRFEALARARRLPDALRRELHLVIDEVVSNIVHAARGSAATRVTLQLTVDRDAITIEVIDNGKAFDPTRAKLPWRGESPVER